MQFELDELNERQKKAVEHIEGPMLILAGAGSGKTRVITNRVAYLIQWGIDPENILALSFTNKAADEMEERVAQLTGPDMAEDVHLSTFHSLGANILRRDIDVLGYKRPFTILDQGDQLSVVENVMEDLNLDSGGGLAAPKILSIISRAKMGFCEPEDLDEYKYDYARPYAQRVYTHYRRALRGLNAVDFDDLLCLPIELFRADEAIRKKYGNKFQYVMVDEYQDTNQTQLLMLRELVKDHENLCVVGDDDQSIYGFRGAIAENILRFEEEFDQTETIKLEQNYRSTNNILEAANVLIEHNSFRKEKELWSAKGKGEKINWVESEDGEEEARFVAAEIERLRQQHRLDWGDFAILYRVNPQSQPFEKALNNAHIPFQVRGSTEFFDRKEVKDFVAYLQATLNHEDELSVRRIVNVPRRGIGPTTMERISNLASDEYDSFFEALQAIAEDPDCIEGIRYKSARKIRHFVETLEEFHDRILEAEEAGEPTAGLCAELLDRIDLLDHVRSRENNPRRARERVGNVQEVIQSIEDFEKHSGNKPLRLFLESITLDRSDPTDDPDDKNAVQLMTLHSSKGLEFPAVFVVGMEQGYLPHSENLGPDDIAEERRLAYVGLTRAQQFLTLTSAMKRTRYGQDLDREPSVFLEELPDEKVRRQRARDRESMREQQEEINEEGLEGLRKAIFDK